MPADKMRMADSETERGCGTSRCASAPRCIALTLLVATGLASTAPAGAQNAQGGNTPPPPQIAPASDGCMLGRVETTPSALFSVTGPGVVTHQGTTLQWRRCSVGQNWDEASALCLGTAQRMNWKEVGKLTAELQDSWRLPREDELETIVERCRTMPTINLQVFPNTPAAMYWTSSRDTGGRDRVWGLSFLGGSAYRAGHAQKGLVRLVKGERPAPQ